MVWKKLLRLIAEPFWDTGNPIEKYVGWAETSSYSILNFSSVIPLLETIFFVFKNAPATCYIGYGDWGAINYENKKKWPKPHFSFGNPEHQWAADYQFTLKFPEVRLFIFELKHS